MTSWLDKFLARFKRETGRDPNPLEVAHNLPSDSEAMLTMVQFMEGKHAW